MKNLLFKPPSFRDLESSAQLQSSVQLIIPELVWKKLICYTRLVTTEISGFGTIQVQGPVLRVTDAFLLRQEVSMSSARITAEDVATWLDQFSRSGGDAATVCLQWHSHGDGAVFWSRTDEDNISNLLSLPPMVVSLEFNRSGHCLCRIDVRQPLRLRFELMPTIELEPLAEADVRQAH